MSAEARLRQLEGEVRVLLAEIGQSVGEPVLPDEYLSNIGNGRSVQPGWTWRPADGWSVHVEAVPSPGGVYVHTTADMFPSDVQALWAEDARALARALLAAADASDASHLLPHLAQKKRPDPREVIR